MLQYYKDEERRRFADNLTIVHFISVKRLAEWPQNWKENSSGTIANECHQANGCHGGIGFTFDVVLALFIRLFIDVDMIGGHIRDSFQVHIRIGDE